MNYNILRYFSTLAQLENYTKAAARLGISQPSLSSAIHNLENDLGGVVLFEKAGRNIHLTKEGRFFQQKVDAALAELESAAAILKDSRENAPIDITLGVVSGALSGIVAEKIAEFSREHERVRFIVTENSAEVLFELMAQEQLDLAIVDTTNRDRSILFRMLKMREFFVALREDHPLADRKELSGDDIADQKQVVFDYDSKESFRKWASGDTSAENIVCSVNTAQAAIDLVSGGAGIAVVPEECTMPREGVRFIPFRNLYQTVYMCNQNDKWMHPLIWEFCEQLVRGIRNPD